MLRRLQSLGIATSLLVTETSVFAPRGWEWRRVMPRRETRIGAGFGLQATLLAMKFKSYGNAKLP